MTTDVSKFIKDNRSLGALYHPTLLKCFGLWNSVSRSNKSSEIAREIMKKNLLTPCATRWNSLYDSIKDLMAVEQAQINEVCRKLSLPLFTNTHIEFLKEYF